MKLADIKAGMLLKAVGSYADCIVEGDFYAANEDKGELFICCREGRHALKSTTNRAGEIPELEPAA